MTKFFVVSEEELERIILGNYSLGLLEGGGGGATSDHADAVQKAEAACRARPVTQIEMADVDDGTREMVWAEYKGVKG